jgi:heptosyltransferase-1
VIESSNGAAKLAPPTRLTDLVEICRSASLMVSGDTGPLHIATAVGTPVVAIFGPTDPHRNGPWAMDDVTVSRYDTCGCHYDRRCTQDEWCLTTIPVSEVTAAVQQRLGARDSGLGARDSE